MQIKPTIKSAIRDELMCALCHDIFNKPQTLIPCLHTFCLDCVNAIPTQDTNGNLTCPNCRKIANSFSSNFSIQNFVDIFNNKSFDETNEIAAIPDMITSTAETAGSSSPLIDVAKEKEHQQDEAGLSNNATSSSSASSYQSVPNSEMKKKPCRSCADNNNTGYSCIMPITEYHQDEYGHLLCGYCSEFMPARGVGGDAPAINQCCSFCGVVACDEYWKCKSRSNAAKLYKLSEITDISTWIQDTDSIEIKEDGHLNKAEIDLLERHLTQSGVSWTEAWNACLNNLDENVFIAPIVRRMTPLGLEIYNIRRLPNDGRRLFDESDEDEDAYDRIREEESILPSKHLRACYSCAVTMVNGQFYGYWKNALEEDLVEDLDIRDKCQGGAKCDAQWRTPSHAQRLCHI